MEHAFTADQIAIACADASLSDAQCESLLLALHYTPAPVQQASVADAVALAGILVGTISSGDIEGDEIDWDAEFDRKVVDALPQLRRPNQHFGLFMAPLRASQPSPAQGDALSQQAGAIDAKTFSDVMDAVQAAHQQGRAAGIEEAAQSMELLCYGMDHGGGGTAAERLRQAQRGIRALNKQEPTS